MKNIILFSSAALVFSGCNNSATTNSKQSNTVDAAKMQMIDTAKLAKGASFYQCPMDKEVITDKPGSCPKCGMDLVKKEKK